MLSHQVHPRHEELGEIHVVVFQICDFNLVLHRLLEMEDPFDQFLAGLVMRMSLAGIDQLKAPGFGSNRSQAFRISEKEICSLVGSNTAGKTDCQHGWVECDVGYIVDVADQVLFFLEVCVPNLFLGILRA